jgi:hypothetical protein
MKGRLIDLSFGMNRKQRITVEVDSDFREEFDRLKDHEVSIEIKKYRKKRSKDANAYAWVLIDKIAAALSIDKEEVYCNAIRSIGGVSEMVCVLDSAVDRLREGWKKQGLGWQTEVMESKLPGCKNVILYFGSSTYDTKQMSLLIDHLVQDAQALGIETETPEQLAKYKEEWGRSG